MHAASRWAMEGRRPRGRRGLKLLVAVHVAYVDWSPPAWAAWIETDSTSRTPENSRVAARVGGVD